MQVGDLVTYWYQHPRDTGKSIHLGLVIETGKYTGNRDVKVLWRGVPDPLTECSQHLTLVDDSLTT